MYTKPFDVLTMAMIGKSLILVSDMLLCEYKASYDVVKKCCAQITAAWPAGSGVKTRCQLQGLVGRSQTLVSRVQPTSVSSLAVGLTRQTTLWTLTATSATMALGQMGEILLHALQFHKHTNFLLLPTVLDLPINSKYILF